MHKHHIKGKVVGVNKRRLCFGACLHWQSQKRDPPNFGSGLVALPPHSLHPQLWFPFRLRHQLVVSVGKFYMICRCIMVQVHKLKKLNSVMNSEINIGVFVGHIHLNKFLIKLFFTKDKWMGVKLYSCLMVTVYTYELIS
jgi:hypothetical protein